MLSITRGTTVYRRTREENENARAFINGVKRKMAYYIYIYNILSRV